MKRILFFNYEYPPLGGGAANATKAIIAEYAAMGTVHVDVVTSSIDEKFHTEKVGEHVHVYRLPIGKNPHNLTYQTKKELITYTYKAYFFAKKLCKKHSYDATHSFFAVPCGVISFWIQKRFNIPYIVSLRGADVPGYSERFTRMYRVLTPVILRVWKNAQCVVTNSTGLTALAQQSNPQQKFLCIPNGVDTTFYHPGARTPDDRKKEFIILCASRLSRRKGFRYAIDALADLVSCYPHVRMIIAGGEGNAMRELKARVREKKLDDYVTFSGAYTKKDAPAIYHNADVFVMPSLNEGMSNNLLEALASGLPVLMTPTGGAQELVRDGENGYLIAMRDAQSIAEKLRALIEHPEQCDEYGRNSRAIAKQMSWKTVAEQYNTLYDTITQKTV